MESDLAEVDHGEIEVIVRSLAFDPDMGVIHDRHCSIVWILGLMPPLSFVFME